MMRSVLQVEIDFADHPVFVALGLEGELWAVNLTPELGYAAGDIVPVKACEGGVSAQVEPFSITGRNTCVATAGSSGAPWRLAKRSAMHWRTFNRLADRIDEIERDKDRAFLISAGALFARMGLNPADYF